MKSKKDVYAIPAKMSNSGSIHDIAEQDKDRLIRFAQGCKYAVVDASHYGGKGYTTHRTEATAIAASERNTNSHQIIDALGACYDVSYDRLTKRLSGA